MNRYWNSCDETLIYVVFLYNSVKYNRFKGFQELSIIYL